MEALIVFVGLCALGVLAIRYGYDSHSAIYSKEEELAGLGMVWDAHLLRLDELRREAALSRRARQLTPASRPAVAYPRTVGQRAMTHLVTRTVRVAKGSLVEVTARQSHVGAKLSVPISHQSGGSASTWSES